MNPLTNVRNVTKLSERELKHGDGKSSWHDQYRDSAWIFIGGLPYDLSEGDVIAVFSQYGEPVNINLIRDKSTGKSKGFAFLCYENQKSTVLAVDNLNGIKLIGRTIRVDHVENYKVPKDNEKVDDLTREIWKEGCAPTSKFGALPPPPTIGKGDRKGRESDDGARTPPSPPSEKRPSLPTSSRDKDRERGEKRSHSESSKAKESSKRSKKSKKSEKEKKKKKKKKHHKKRSRKDSTSSSSSSESVSA